MVKWFVFLTSLVGLLAVCGPARAEDKKVADNLDGKWELVFETLDGVATDPGEVKGRFVVSKGEKLTAYFKDKVLGTATQKLDPGKSPKHVDVTYEDGPIKGTTLKGIYKLEGDTLTICMGGVGKDRPKEFGSEPGSGDAHFAYKRVK